MKFNALLVLIILALCAMLLSSCKTVAVSYPASNKKVTGPPAHAPAHGYRRKLASNVEVVFDSDSGVYVVIGWNHHFWLDGLYYRFSGDQWQVSVTIDGGWKGIGKEKLPPGLRTKQFAQQSPGNHPGRGLALGRKK